MSPHDDKKSDMDCQDKVDQEAYVEDEKEETIVSEQITIHPKADSFFQDQTGTMISSSKDARKPLSLTSRIAGIFSSKADKPKTSAIQTETFMTGVGKPKKVSITTRFLKFFKSSEATQQKQFDLSQFSGELAEKDETITMARPTLEELEQKDETITMARPTQEELEQKDETITAASPTPEELQPEGTFITAVGTPPSLATKISRFITSRRKRETKKDSPATAKIKKPKREPVSKKPISQKVPIPKIPSRSKASNIQVKDRILEPEVFAYMKEAMRVTLDNPEIIEYRKTYTKNLPNKFIAPNSHGRMCFVSEEEAKRKGGSVFKIVIIKECPDGETVYALRKFIRDYEKKGSDSVSSVKSEDLKKISQIFKARHSGLRDIFKSPYRIKAGNTIGSVIIALQNSPKSNFEDPNFVKFFDELVNQYYYMHNEPLSARIVKRHEILMVSKFLGKDRERFFVDMRKQLQINNVVDSAKRMLQRMKKSYYTMRITSQTLSIKQDWISKVSPPISLGIKKINEGEVEELKEYFENYIESNHEKIEALVNGQLMMRENARDFARRHQRGNRQEELEDLIIPYEKIKKILPKGKFYHNVDSHIKAIGWLQLFISVHLALLATICSFSGTLVSQFYTKGQPIFRDIPVVGQLGNVTYDIASITLFFWAMANCWLAIGLRMRRGRIGSITNALLWIAFCGLLVSLGGILGYIHILGFFVGGYMLYALGSQKMAAHFYPELGRLHCKLSLIDKVIMIWTLVMIGMSVAYLLAISHGVIDGNDALVGNWDWLFRSLPF